MRRVRRGQFALTAVAATAAFVASSAAPAAASISGPCTATIGGTNVAGLSTGATSKAIVVKQGDNVLVTMSAGKPMTHLKLTLAFSGLNGEVTIKDKDISSQSWSETVEVDRYAKWGKGLYLVKGESTGNGFSCTGAALVKVEGNPLSSVAGAVGLGMAILGVAGVGVAGVAAYRVSARPKRSIEAWTADQLESLAATDQPPQEPAPARSATPSLDDVADAVQSASGGMFFCWTLALPALLLTTGAMIGGGGGASPGGPTGGLPRAHWRPRISWGGMLAGLVAGAGIGVLLQQYGVAYPTSSLTVIYLVAGLLAGVVVPSVMRWFAVRSVNHAIDDAEKRIAAARA